MKTSSQKFESFVPIFLILLGCFLRFYGIDFQPLWIDELIDWSIVTLPNVQEIIEKSLWTAQIPTGYLFYRTYIQIFSESVFALRLIPVLLSCLSLFYLALLIKKFFNNQTLLLSLCFFCFNPILIWHAQEFRPYSSMLCFSIMSTFYLLNWLEEKNHRHFLFFVFSSALLTQSHHFGLLFILMQPLCLKIYQSTLTKAQIKKYTITVLSLIALQVPWLNGFAYYLFSDNADLFYAQIDSSLMHALKDYWALLYKPQNINFSYLILTLAILSGLNYLIVQKSKRKRAIQDRVIMLFFVWAMLPFALFYVSQSLLKGGGYPSRYLLFCLPYLVIAISYCLQNAIKHRLATPLLCLTLIGFQIPSFVGNHSV